jgi:peroxiredoxin
MWTRSFLTMFVLAVLSSCISDDSDKDSQGVNLVVGDSLPTFQVTMNDGSTIRTSDLLGGVSVVVLFSVDCGDCRMELPEVQRLWNQQLGVPIVLIARENTEEVIRSFWQQAQLTMSYSPQSDRKVYSLFASSRIPRIYISDAQGVIRFSHADDAMSTAEQLADEIKAINNK